jgi:hypothetical protein
MELMVSLELSQWPDVLELIRDSVLNNFGYSESIQGKKKGKKRKK